MQFLLDFGPRKDEPPKTQRIQQQRLALRRGAIRWLLESGRYERPAIGIDVPVRGNSLRADVAAATCKPQRITLDDGKPAIVMAPETTVAILTFANRNECWPECNDIQQILAELETIRQKRPVLEETIRQTEPMLRDSDVLFEEYACWNYANSTNVEYQQLLKRINTLETMLFQGTKPARIEATHTVNEILIAVPPGVISPSEVLDSYGLLEVNTRTLEINLRQEPKHRDTLCDLQSTFALNIAAANTKQVCDCHGLRVNDNKSVDILKMPTFRHRKL